MICSYSWLVEGSVYCQLNLDKENLENGLTNMDISETQLRVSKIIMQKPELTGISMPKTLLETIQNCLENNLISPLLFVIH